MYRKEKFSKKNNGFRKKNYVMVVYSFNTYN